MSTQLGGIVASPGDVRTIRSPLGGAVTFLARGDETDGALSAFAVTVPPLEGPPLHVHRDLDETIYVLEGDFRWKLAGEIHPSQAGSFVFIPRGLAHCFQNIGEDEGRMLITFAPAGMEGFFEQQADLEGFDLETFRSAAAREGMDVVGPPLAQSDPL